MATGSDSISNHRLRRERLRCTGVGSWFCDGTEEIAEEEVSGHKGREARALLSPLPRNRGRSVVRPR